MRTRSAVLSLLLLIVPVMASAAEPPGPRRAYMDTTCSPCRDFFEYANGTWLRTTEIPAAYSTVGMGREIADRNQVTITRVLERAAAEADGQKDATLRKLGRLYAVLMDSARADREGLEPLRADLDRIAAIRTREDLRREFARLDGFSPFGFGPEVDPRASTRTIAQVIQGGLGLPDRDYYFRTDEDSEGHRKAYVEHLGRVLRLCGTSGDEATAAAARVMALETALAESSLSVTEMRDPERLYHKMTVRELQALCPTLEWTAFFREAGVPSVTALDATLDVSTPAFMRRLGQELERTPLEDWKAYLAVHTARGALPWLGRDAFEEMFTFNARFTGQAAPTPRWKRAANTMDGAMGEALGKAYVATEFPASSKAKMTELVDNLRRALRERIRTRPWMGEATRKQALAKLEAVLPKIGYPDRWRDYTALEIDPAQPAFENLRRAQVFELKRQMAKIGKPVDRAEWQMTASTVNAYYNPPTNEICFPAGILQPPMFDPNAEDAVNYGAIGAVIGHELTHGFDDEGRKYDHAGNLREWWTEEDGKEFERRTKALVAQYDGYLVDDTMHVNGTFTLGENLGDLGGVSIAYAAWRLSLEGKPAPRPVAGFTPEQRFFLSFGQIWRRLYRPQLTRLIALTDPHSLPRWRVVGPLSNLPEFARAFGCAAGDPMVLAPEKRTDIW